MNSDILMKKGFYLIYLTGFFLIILQILNIIPLWSDPPEWGKAIFFRIFLALLIAVFISQILAKKIELEAIKRKISSAKLPFIFLVLLFLAFLLATIFSVNSRFSLWGDPFRCGGFVNFAFYIIFAILLFLLVKDSDWKKILNFLILISIFVCIVAFMQQFGVFSKILIPISVRPISTLGNPMLLSIYLLLTTFFPIILGMGERNKPKKIFYFFCSFIFFFVAVFLAQTRFAYLGFFVGGLFFFFLYPKKTDFIKKLKIAGLALLILFIAGSFFLKIYLDQNISLYKKAPAIFSDTLDRALSLYEGSKIAEARASTWKVSFEAFKEKPIFGYGPENFMVAFDKYYDPSLPKIGRIASGESFWQWFDRAHNVIFETLITGGLFALIIYFSFFGILIWKLQKAKYNGKNDGKLMIHSLQATFIGYIVCLFSAFDSVSTYIISFLLIGYSLHLISINNNLPYPKNDNKFRKQEFRGMKTGFPNIIILALVFIGTSWFIWNYNLKVLFINKEMNLALAYADLRKTDPCEKAFSIVNDIYPSASKSVISNYLNQKITYVIYGCNDKIKSKGPEDLINQNIEILKGNIKTNPQYVINWLLIGEYSSILIKEKNLQTENVFIESAENKKLKNETEFYFETANKLSPRRQLVLKDWGDFYTITGDYKKGEEKLQECINLNPYYGLCYWYMALNKGYQKNTNEFKKYSKLAEDNGVVVESQDFLQELVNMHIRNNDYQGLAQTYPRLINLAKDPLEKAQLHASLAATYKELGDIKKARAEVLKIKDIIPSLPKSQQEIVENEVEQFLQILQ